VRLLECLFGLFTRCDIRQSNDAASNFAPGVQQWTEAQEELKGLAIRPYKGGLDTLLHLASQCDMYDVGLRLIVVCNAQYRYRAPGELEREHHLEIL
jgi:hypothetical protein